MILNLLLSLIKGSKFPYIFGLIILGSLCYFIGKNNGYDSCKLEWDKYIKDNVELNQKLQQQYLDEKTTLLNENTKLAQEILNYEQKYQNSINNIKSEYSDRLHKSEERALYYQSMSTKVNSKGCTTASLANHTARLDKQLTEGINLVRELRELIKLRDSQLRQCGEQINLLVKE